MEKKIKSISVEAFLKLLQKHRNKIGFDHIEPDIINFWYYDKYQSGKEKHLGIRRLV